MRIHCIVTILLIAILLPLNNLSAQDSVATLSIGGAVEKPMQWSVEQLKKQFADQIQEVKYKGNPQRQRKTATGIPLLSVIQASEPKLEKQSVWAATKQHHDMFFLVILGDITDPRYEGTDEPYYVFFSLAELMPEFGRAQAWLVWDIDGQPITDKREAPIRLVVLDDEGLDRDIYHLNKITLVDCVKLANQLVAK